MKLLSIIIPNFNHSRFLPALLDSIFKVNQKDLIKLIVVDGSSTDGFFDHIARYKSEIDVLISEEDSGQANAINKGIRYVDTKYWMWQNSDDYFSPQGLTNILAHLKTSDIDLIQCQTVRNYNDRVIPVPLVACPAFLYRRRPYFLNNQSLIFNNKLNIVLNESFFYAFDLDLFYRCITKYRVHVFYNVLGIYRSHQDTKTHKYIHILNEEMLKIGHLYKSNFKSRSINLFCRIVDLVYLSIVNPRSAFFNIKGMFIRGPW